MPYTKIGPFVDGGAPYLSAATLTAMDAALVSAGAYVSPEAYVQTGDAGDWALAITRALAAATPAGLPVILQKLYPVKTTVTLNSGDTLIGGGPTTGLQAPTNTAIDILTANAATGLVLQNFTVDGNCATSTTKAFSRSIRLINCTRVRLHQITTRYNPDWACSFQGCTDVYVTDYVHQNGATGNTGAFAGRDGIHFLDCTDVVLDGAKIHSYDDCVGITSTTQNIARIAVRNVTGLSEVAAVVTLGNEAATAFAATDITIENISSMQVTNFGGLSSYGVKLRAQNGAKVTNLSVSNVRVAASLYGVWLDATNGGDMDGVNLTNIRATSTGNHGVYCINTWHVNAVNVWGQSATATTDGIHLSYVQASSFHGGGSTGSGLWGLQMNNCVSVDVWGMVCRDNGAAAFGSSTGGNLRVVNCTTVSIYGGQYVGSATVSYFGASYATNTTLNTATVPPTVAGAH